MPWAKGQSGNPGGRSKTLSAWRNSDEAKRLRDLSYKALEEAVTAANIEWRDRIHAAGMLLDRIEGKPIQAISGPEEGPIRIQTASLLDTLRALSASGG